MAKNLLIRDEERLQKYLEELEIEVMISYNGGQYKDEDSYDLGDIVIYEEHKRIDFRIDAPFTKYLLYALSDKLKTTLINFTEQSSSGCDTCGHGAGEWLEFSAYGSELFKEFDSRLEKNNEH